MTAPGNGPVRLPVDDEFDPKHFPSEMERTSEKQAIAREQSTLLRKLEKVLLAQLALNFRRDSPTMTKAEATEAALLSPEYESHVRKLAAAERSYLLWTGRYEAAKAGHESSRTSAATQRAALYPRG